MDEPKKCPFCGRIPEVIRLETAVTEYYVACRSIYCVEQKHLYASRAAAVKAWNRRKPLCHEISCA